MNDKLQIMSVIYRLTDSNNHFYIGSTTNLHQRLFNHRNSHNKCCSKKLCDDWVCDILEHTDKVGDDLLWLERKYFDAHYGSPLFVNTNKPIRTEEEIREYNHQYKEQNKDKIKANKQQYREQNKDKIKAKDKAYYEQNKDKIKAKDKAYYEQNKDNINARKQQHYQQNKAYRAQKIECECGSVVRRDKHKRHKLSKKHINYIQRFCVSSDPEDPGSL